MSKQLRYDLILPEKNSTLFVGDEVLPSYTPVN